MATEEPALVLESVPEPASEPAQDNAPADAAPAPAKPKKAKEPKPKKPAAPRSRKPHAHPTYEEVRL